MKSKGLGDTVEKVIKKVFPKMSPCTGCKKRKDRLNKLVKYGSPKR